MKLRHIRSDRLQARVLGIVVALASALAVADADAARTGNYCQVASICLDVVPPQCGRVMDVSVIRDSDVPIERRCAPARNLHERGVDFGERAGIEALNLLGRRYLVDYEMLGVADVSAHKLAYLLDHLPFTARLISSYRGGDYHAEYKRPNDKSVVKGGKGERFSGEARLLAGDARQGRLIYQGFGTANVGKWSFRGELLIDFEFQPHPDKPKQSVYRVRALASPGNAVLNALMESAAFREISERMIAGLIDDLATTVAALENDRPRRRRDRDRWNDADRDQIRTLMRLK